MRVDVSNNGTLTISSGETGVNGVNNASNAFMFPSTKTDISQAITVFLVLREEIGGGATPIPFGNPSSIVSNETVIRQDSTGFWRLYSGSNVDVTDTGSVGNTRVIGSVINGASSLLDVEGVGSATGNAGTTAYRYSNLFGHREIVSMIFRGDIFEMWIFDTALSATKVSNINAILQARHVL